jgi:restriction endonuclease
MAKALQRLSVEGLKQVTPARRAMFMMLEIKITNQFIILEKLLRIIVIIADLLIFDAVNNEMPHLPFNNGADFINEFLRIVFKIIEAEFARSFEQSDDVKVYAKLPGWFKIDTPLGSYNPDWAVLVDHNDEEKLYFVVNKRESQKYTRCRSINSKNDQYLRH